MILDFCTGRFKSWYFLTLVCLGCCVFTSASYAASPSSLSSVVSLKLRNKKIEGERAEIFDKRKILQEKLKASQRERWQHQELFFSCARNTPLAYRWWKGKFSVLDELEGSYKPLIRELDSFQAELSQGEKALEQERKFIESNKDQGNYDLNFNNYVLKVESLQLMYRNELLPALEVRAAVAQTLNDLYKLSALKCDSGEPSSSIISLISPSNEELQGGFSRLDVILGDLNDSFEELNAILADLNAPSAVSPIGEV